VVVRADASLQRSVVHDNAYVGQSVQLRGTVIGRATDLRPYSRCEEGVVLGDECLVGAHAVVNTGVKVYPYKTVEPGAIINSSIVWESRGSRSLFGAFGVSGLANVDVTPELAVRVAMAYGTTMKKGSTVITSRDTSRAARALKRAMMAGLNAAGINVDDLEMAAVPVTRFAVRTQRAQGGITVRLAPGDPQSVAIRFFDPEGTDLDEAAQRKIERIFHRQDFRRALAAEIGDIGFPPRALEHYTAALVASVDVGAIRAAGFRVVLDYAYGSTSTVMPSVLAPLGADVLSVNAYAATAGAVTFDPTVHAERVAALVRTANAHLGAVIDPDGEHIVLIDDEGRVLDNDQALMALVTLVGRARKGARIALPVSATRATEAIVSDTGAELVWTKQSSAHLMQVAGSEDITLAAAQDGGFIFGDFLPAFDATATFVHLLALLAGSDEKLSSVVAGLAKVHVAHETVDTAWEEKGVFMRKLVEKLKDADVLLVDGVKVQLGSEWALVLPDPQEPMTHVWAEGDTDARARSLVQEYARKVRKILG
ncbi:MAG: mannose-1-phosphate guanyltransferase, partial [Actinomycetota bacterium]|nr:mannose-1-phosphate guanyltransferase [Actinomycetota bacterium]